MKKKVQMLLGIICYVLGGVIALYIGGIVMVIKPLMMLYHGFMEHTLNLAFVFTCGMQILLSSTAAGFIWCVGYIGYNYFKGTEDPDWETINSRVENGIEIERKSIK